MAEATPPATVNVHKLATRGTKLASKQDCTDGLSNCAPEEGGPYHATQYQPCYRASQSSPDWAVTPVGPLWIPLPSFVKQSV